MPVEALMTYLGDELLHVLVGAVVVGAVGDGDGHPVGAVAGMGEHVGASLGANTRHRMWSALP